MKILVTGSTGFVGKHLIPALIEDGHIILEITRDIGKSTDVFGDKTQKFQITEIQQELNFAVSCFEPEVCIHLASYLTSSDDYNDVEKLIQTNISFLCSILEALRDTKLKLFVNTGTFAEYQEGNGELDPAYFYAATKTASRSFVNYYSKIGNYKSVTVLPYTIYGGNDTQKKIIDIIIESLDNDKAIDLSPGEQVLDFIHINDVVEFYKDIVMSISTINNKDVYHLGTGKGYSLKDLTGLIEKLSNKKANINWGGKAYRTSDVMNAIADLDLNKHIEWESKVKLVDGIKRLLVQYYE